MGWAWAEQKTVILWTTWTNVDFLVKSQSLVMEMWGHYFGLLYLYCFAFSSHRVYLLSALFRFPLWLDLLKTQEWCISPTINQKTSQMINKPKKGAQDQLRS